MPFPDLFHPTRDGNTFNVGHVSFFHELFNDGWGSIWHAWNSNGMNKCLLQCLAKKLKSKSSRPNWDILSQSWWSVRKGLCISCEFAYETMHREVFNLKRAAYFFFLFDIVSVLSLLCKKSMWESSVPYHHSHIFSIILCWTKKF